MSLINKYWIDKCHSIKKELISNIQKKLNYKYNTLKETITDYEGMVGIYINITHEPDAFNDHILVPVKSFYPDFALVYSGNNYLIKNFESKKWFWAIDDGINLKKQIFYTYDMTINPITHMIKIPYEYITLEDLFQIAKLEEINP